MSLEERVEILEIVVKDLNERINKLENLIYTENYDTKIKKKKKISLIDILEKLKSEGFFNEPRSLSDIYDELKRQGYFYPRTSLSAPLLKAVRKSILGRIKIDGAWHYVRR